MAVFRTEKSIEKITLKKQLPFINSSNEGTKAVTNDAHMLIQDLRLLSSGQLSTDYSVTTFSSFNYYQMYCVTNDVFHFLPKYISEAELSFFT